MRWLCFGAGAIGSYIGGSLQLAGESVVFVTQASMLPQLETDGITIEYPSGEIRRIAKVTATADAVETIRTGSFDAAIIAVKSFDTEALMNSLAAAADLLPPFISLQNGVENEAVLLRFLGKERIIPASVCTAISRSSNGAITVEKLRGIGIGANHPLSMDVQHALSQAGLKPQLFDNPTAMKWSKLLSNLIANAASAILDMTPGEIFTDPDGFNLELRQLKETIAVMNALSIPVINLPGTPMKVLARAADSLPVWLLKPILRKAVSRGRGQKKPSLHIDLHAGRRQSEVEYLNGAVVRFAKTVRLSVPVNASYSRILTDMVNGEIAPDHYRHNPRALAADIQQETD